MQATEILKSEHRVIERVLTAVEAAVDKLQRGEEVRPGFFLDVAQFVKGFADGCHHQKEEGALFKTMVAYGAPQEGPIAVMLWEHDQGRAYIQALRAGALEWQAGELSARQKVIENALGYVHLLRQHIMKEDEILFPLADQVIPVEKYAQVSEEFDRVEHEETGEGVHEKYLALAEALERESLAIGTQG